MKPVHVKRVIGDIRIEAIGHGDGTWYIGTTRVSTDECLSAGTHRCSDFEAGRRFGEEVALWFYSQK